MAAPTETYVDPSIAGNSGTGTVGDPYGDLQYALDTMTRDATDGDRINIKTGTAEILAAILDFSTYGTPDASAPLILQGYTTAAGDGGQGDIDGNGAKIAVFPTYTQLVDLHIHNAGVNQLADIGAHAQCVRVEFSDGGSGSSVFNSGSLVSSILFLDCHVHDIGISYRVFVGSMTVIGCYLSGAVFRGIDFSTNGVGHAERNTFNLTGASVGIYSRERSHIIRNNSILATSGTGAGIELTSASDFSRIENNVIEGFIGAGGDGILVAAGGHIGLYRGNAFFNNTANETGVSGAVFVDEGDNESLASTGFAKSGANTYANRATYYEPNDVGNMRGGAHPTLLRFDKGAVQHADPAGGGGAPGNMSGGLQ